MAKAVNNSDAYTLAPLAREHVDNFYNLITGDVWTILAADAGSTVTQAVGGGAVLTSDGTANDEVTLYTTSFIVPGTTASVPFEITARVKISALTTLGWFSGLSSAFGANLLADGLATVPSSGYYNGLYMLSGDTRLRYLSVHNAAATVDQVLDFAPTAGAWFSYRLRYTYGSSVTKCVVSIDSSGGQEFKPVNAYVANVTPKDAHYESPNVYAAFPAAGLKYGTYVKCGGTASVTTVDYVAWSIKR